jgi:membrane protease YdiL (CAAX protease family)
MAGLPLLIAEMTLLRFVEQPRRRLNLVVRRPLLDLSLIALGVFVGLAGFIFLRPAPLLPGAGGLLTLGGTVVLVVFGAFPEELLFRGLLLSASIDASGNRAIGLAYATVMSALMYVGSGSVSTILATGYGLLLGTAVLGGGSVWGAAASRGAALIGMFVLWPAVFGSG